MSRRNDILDWLRKMIAEEDERMAKPATIWEHRASSVRARTLREVVDLLEQAL